jgi:Fic family protein
VDCSHKAHNQHKEHPFSNAKNLATTQNQGTMPSSGARFDDNSPRLQNSTKHADHSYAEQLLKNKSASSRIGNSTSSFDDRMLKSSKSTKTNEQDPKYKALEALQTIQKYFYNQEETDHRDPANMEKEKEIQRLKVKVI